MIGAVVLCGVIILQNQVTYFSIVKPGIDEVQKGMDGCFVPIGKWFHDNTPPGTIILAEDIGALGYYSKRPVIGASTMVSPAHAQLLSGGRAMEDMYTEKAYRRTGAQYLVHSSQIPAELTGDRGLEPVLTDTVCQVDLAATRSMYYTIYKILPDSAIAQ